MGKLISNFFISLDGVVEAPHEWHFPYFDEHMGKAVEKGMETAAAFLMGRVLYEEWSSYWPNAEADQEFAQFINETPKYVVSDSLTEASWQNSTIISGDVEAQIKDLKERTDRDIAMSGSPTTVRWLLEHGLVDELHLLVHPIAVGHGQRLFQDTPTHPLELRSTETFPTGVLYLVYAPAPAQP